MYEYQELIELGERVAEDGVHRHERAVRRLAAAVATRLPGAAAVLRDSTAPTVLRERAFSVAAQAMVRAGRWPDQPRESAHAARTERARQQPVMDRRGQLAGRGV